MNYNCGHFCAMLASSQSEGVWRISQTNSTTRNFSSSECKNFLRTPQLFSELEIFKALPFAPGQSVYGIPSEGFLGSPNLSTLKNNRGCLTRFLIASETRDPY